MFTEGRIYFTLAFIAVFIIVLFFAYRGDRAVHKKFFKRTYLIVAVVVAFVVLFMLTKRYLLGL